MCVYTFVCGGPKTVLGVWHVVPQILFTFFLLETGFLSGLGLFKLVDQQATAVGLSLPP